jgi:hypothetical protein
MLSWRLGRLWVTKLPPFALPAHPSRSPFARPPLPWRSCSSWPLTRRSLLIAEPSSKGSVDSPSTMLTGTTLAGLMTGASFRPPKSLLGPSDENGHRKSLRKRTPGSIFVQSSSPLPSFPCVCWSSPLLFLLIPGIGCARLLLLLLRTLCYLIILSLLIYS